ncbi:TonB family protein [Labrys wisconsinensis]|uniref:TonB family protein n=1 Tax=Labrys wisconsinensis TaxID=425677 RepID=A0ABU0J5W6_9HYPH|nr:TonB family protein [Labrys wisconsinensis]MDQ0469624.1 TonB family protein [Labrys wisconsinensis]
MSGSGTWALRDARPVAIVVSALAHAALALTLSVVPAGTETRNDRPIEASLAPVPEVAPTPVDPSLESVETASVDEALTSSETSEVKPVETEEAVTAQAATQTPPTEVAAETPPTKAAPAETAEQPPPPETTPTEMAQAVEQQAPEEAPTELQAQAVAPVEVEPVVTTTAETATTVAAVTPPPARPVERPAKPTPRPKPPAAKREHEPAKPTLAALRPTTRSTRVVGGAPSDIGSSTTARAAGATQQEYGRLVRARAQSRFRSVGTARLTALIAFRVAADGSVVSSRVSRSSGDQVFDQRAVSTMQSLSLPPPPGGTYAAVLPFEQKFR